jgi:hypothetical protein
MRHVLVALCGGVLLAGCGAKIGSKQDAANAIHSLTLAGNAAYTNTNNGANVNATVTGKNGGTATVSISTTSSNATMTVNFNNFDDGRNTFNGSMTYAFDATYTSSSVNLGWMMNGTVTMSGSYNDTLSVNNLTETVSVVELAQNSGQVSVNLNGTVIADGDTYTFSNESWNVTVSP